MGKKRRKTGEALEGHGMNRRSNRKAAANIFRQLQKAGVIERGAGAGLDLRDREQHNMQPCSQGRSSQDPRLLHPFRARENLAFGACKATHNLRENTGQGTSVWKPRLQGQICTFPKGRPFFSSVRTTRPFLSRLPRTAHFF